MTANDGARAATFINVDLEVRGERPAPDLLDAAREHLFVLHEGTPFVFSAELPTQPDGMDTAVAGLVAFIENLNAEARAQWDACPRKVLNAGFACARAGQPAEFDVSSDAMAAIARIGAGLSITIYATDDDAPLV